MSKIKEFYQKPLVKETVILILNSMMAGFILTMAGVAYMLSPTLDGTKLPGAFMFSFGLLVIILFEMKLFTGMLGNWPYTPFKKSWTLFVCFVFNCVGIWICSLIVRGTSIATKIVEGVDVGLIAESLKIVNKKTGQTGLQMFCSAIFCGMCMTIGVLGCRAAKDKHFSATFFVVLPIMVFILCGFEHSVANMIYIFISGAEWTGEVWLLIAMGVLGNIVGCVMIPLYKLIEGKKYLVAPVAAHPNPTVNGSDEKK